MFMQQVVDISKTLMWNQDVQPLHATSYYPDIWVLRVSKKPLGLSILRRL
jgi:hypothetical protein